MTSPLDHALLFLRTLHPHEIIGGLVEITGLAPRRKPIRRYFTDTRLAAEFACDMNMRGYSAFTCVNPRVQMRGRDADVLATVALPLDLQPERSAISGVVALLERFGIPASIAAVSGHGAHLYLLLRYPENPIKARSTAERLCKATNSDPIFNPARIMRLPGSINWKSTPVWCHLTDVYPARRYELQQVEQALDAMGAPSGKPARDVEVVVPTVPTFDWQGLRRNLAGATLMIIDSGEGSGGDGQVTRSETDWLVVCALVRAGATDDQVRWVYDNYPIGQLKYKEAGARYLTRTIEAARRATAEPKRSGRPAPDRGERFNGGARDQQRLRKTRRGY